MGRRCCRGPSQAAGLGWDAGEAHSAVYDAERTADLFCMVCNQFQPLYEAAAERLSAAIPSAEPPNPLLEPEPE